MESSEGLFQVFGKDNGSNSRNPIVNIVFVHGLGGHPLRTWECKKTTANQVSNNEKLNASKLSWLHRSCATFPGQQSNHGQGDENSQLESTHQEGHGPEPVFWPADMLPTDVANIWTYGYNADVSEGVLCSNSRNSVLYQHGNDLKVKLERLGNDLPVIFVAHDLGGIVAKIAISLCSVNHSTKLNSLLSRVYAIVFCGTPHRGATAEAWGLLLTNSETAALQSFHDRLLPELLINSETKILDDIQDDFLRVLHGTQISVHSYQESRGLSGLSGKVVEDFSSKLGHPFETTETIDANHMDMVSIGAREISAVINRYVGDIKKNIRV